jgi:sulfur carrier protein
MAKYVLTWAAFRNHPPPPATGASPPVHVIVNEQPQQYPDGLTVTQLLEQLGLAGKPVAVERNQDLVPRGEHPTTVLQDGDRLEIVSLTGGG